MAFKAQLQALKLGARHIDNSQQMRNITRHMSEAEIKEAANSTQCSREPPKGTGHGPLRTPKGRQKPDQTPQNRYLGKNVAKVGDTPLPVRQAASGQTMEWVKLATARQPSLEIAWLGHGQKTERGL